MRPEIIDNLHAHGSIADPAQYEWVHNPDLYVQGELAKPALIMFAKDGKRAILDIADGKLTYSGDVEITDAAKSLFEALVVYLDEAWLERAATKNHQN